MALKHSNDRKLVRAVANGSSRASRKLVARLEPVIRSRCGRVLTRSTFRCGRDIRQQVEDMTQEVFLVLFDHECRELLRWDPVRGLSLENFVGVIAYRQTLALLRTGKRNPWYEEPLDEAALSEVDDDGPTPDELVIRRDLLLRIVAEFDRTLSTQAHLMFQLLVLESRPVDEVRSMTGLSSDAVYAWRSRLLKRIRRLAVALDSDPVRGAAAEAN